MKCPKCGGDAKKYSCTSMEGLYFCVSVKCSALFTDWQQERITILEATLSKIESLCNQYKVLNINRYAKLAAIAGKWREK